MAADIAVDVARVIVELGNLALWLQALGVIVILWIVFEVVSLYFHRKRMKEVYAIKADMKRIEGKIDTILKQRR